MAIRPYYPHTVKRDSSQVHEHRESIPSRSCLDVHLAVPVQKASVYNGVEGGRSHERKEESAERAPCWFAETPYKQNEDGCQELSSQIKLAKCHSVHSPDGDEEGAPYAYPENLRLPRRARKGIPYTWWKAAGSDGTDTK